MSTDIEHRVETEATASPPEQAAQPLQGAGKNRTRILLLLLAALLVLGFWIFENARTRQAAATAQAQASKAPPSIPVAVASARAGDIPVYLNGLGSVTPLNTVTVRTRLDGQLTHVDFQEGQFVTQGKLLAEIDPRPYEVQLAQAQAQLARDQATLDNAKTDLARYQYLADKGIIPKQQLDTQASVVVQDAAVIKVDDAQIDNAKLQLTYCRITAPISGRIGLRLVDQGNLVHAADANGLVIITQIQPIAVVFTIPEDSLNSVIQKFRGGQRLAAEAYDRSGQTKLVAGRLLTMDNEIDPTTGTNRLKAVFENTANALFPNQFVNIQLLVETQKDKVLIPAVAIQRGPNGAFVYAVKPDQTVEVRKITVGTMQGSEAAIETGLAEGEQVVVDGVDKLQAGSKVQVGAKPEAGMSPSRIFIERPVATSLFMAAILLSGLVAYFQLPVSALPQVDYPTIQVLTFYPGASPDVMASSVTAPLERQFGQMPGLNQMTSSSSFGSSLITLQFDLELSLDVAEQEVQASINAGTTFLPKDLPNPPIYNKTNPADAPIITLALTSDTLPLAKVEDLADTRLAQKLSQLAGVGLVSISGGQKPAVRIQANTTALAAYGMSLEDLRNSVAQANVNQATGNFDGPKQAYTIDTNDQIISSDGYRSMIIAYRNGGAVRLSDVATVIDDAENVKQAAWTDMTPAVILNIQRQPGANIIGVVDRIEKLLPQLKASLPSAVNVSVLTDRTATIRASVKDVQFSLMLTVALVVMVIFLFLRTLSATVIPSIAVPLSLIGTFGVMYLLGYSLDNLSLMALTISTGFVVDDAIVMIENISRYIEEGDSPLEAALKGSEQIGFTIISLTVSLIAVLIPLLFMGDVVGRLFREFAITLSVTILFSAVVSLTLTPMMCSKLLKHRPKAEQGKFYRWSEKMFEAVIRRYGVTLGWVLRHQSLTLLVAALTLAGTIFLYVVAPKGFFPVQDTGLILGISEAPQSVSFKGMMDRQQALVDVILRDPAVQSLSSFIGIDGTNITANSGRIQINLKPLEERNANATEIIRRLQSQLEQVAGITLYMQPVQDLTIEDRVSRTQYQYSLEDPNTDELQTWTTRLVQRLQTLPQLRDVASDQQNHGLQVSLDIDRDTASRLGITPQMIDDSLYDGFGQRQISTIFTQLNQYHVVLEAKPEFQQNPDALKNIYVKSPTGTQVPLSSFARFEPGTTSLTINHQGQFPATTISFNLAPGVALGDAVAAINGAKQEIGLPASIQAEFQGAARAFQSSLANEPVLILAALLTVYIVLGVLYESYIHPLTILSTLPSAGVGAILALMLCRIELDVIALIGIILLIGIVKKNAIMMIDFALEAEREHGKEPEEAIYQACLLRFRPIMMTTMAALLGGLPLALGSGTGAELRRPLGITIVGGLIVSQMLTLYTTPVIYLAFDRIARRLKRTRGTETKHGELQTAEQ